MHQKNFYFLIVILGIYVNVFANPVDNRNYPRRVLLCPDSITLAPRVILIYDEFAVIDYGERMEKNSDGNFDNKGVVKARHKVDMKNLTFIWRSNEPTQCIEINVLSR